MSVTIAALAAALDAAPTLRQMAVPAAAGSGMYSLTTAADGRTYLSWLEPAPDKRHALRFSVLEQGEWAPARTVATGADWFVNWADHPSVTALADGTLVAHWLVNNPSREAKSYGYGLRLARSTDGGTSWTEVFSAGTDNTTGYSGFVSLLPRPRGFAALYLTPPKATGALESAHGGEHADHMMTVSVAHFGPGGTLLSDTQVDEDACTCCGTSLIETSDGLLAAYRDHRGSVRGISVVRFRHGSWSSPTTVHADNWLIDACPTNGPVLAAAGRRVGITWFTAAGNEGRVKFSVSRDGGVTFGAPVVIDEGKPIGWPGLVMLDDGSSVVSWLEATQGGDGEVRMRRVSAEGRLGPPLVVAAAKAGRSTGIPQLARAGDKLVVAWRAGDRVTSAMTNVPAL